MQAVSKAKKAIARLHGYPVKKPNTTKALVDVKEKEKVLVNVDDDDDDFVSPPPPRTVVKSVQKDTVICSATSSDDFETQFRKYQPPAQPLVLSNKRPTKVSKKLMKDVPEFVPYKFPCLVKAKQFRDLILSPDYLKEHGE